MRAGVLEEPSVDARCWSATPLKVVEARKTLRAPGVVFSRIITPAFDQPFVASSCAT